MDGSPSIFQTSTFTVQAATVAMLFSTDTLAVSTGVGQPTTRTVNLNTSNGTARSFTIADNADWLGVTPATGNTPATLTLTINSGLAAGNYTANVLATSPGAQSDTLVVNLTVGLSPYSLVVSQTANRASPAPLQGQTVAGTIYVFTTPDTSVTQVQFFLDDPNMTGAPRNTENSGPYDFAGGSAGSANPFNTNTIADGPHTITARLTVTNSPPIVISAEFNVSNNAPALLFNPASLTFNVAAGQTNSSNVSLSTSSGGAASFTLAENAPWMSVTPQSGNTPATITVQVDATGLAAGAYSETITATAQGMPPATLSVTLNVGGAGGAYQLLVSHAPDRSSPAPLQSANVGGSIYVFTSPNTGVDQVSFWLDNPAMTGTANTVENSAPYDFKGGTSAAANPFDTLALTDGSHTISALIRLTAGGTTSISATFTIANGAADRLDFVQPSISFSLGTNASLLKTADLVATGSAAKPFTITGAPAWLTVQPTSGNTPATISLTANSSGLSAGTYNATLTASSNAGFLPDTLPVTLTVGSPTGVCSPLPCNQILVNLPYSLTFDQNHGKILDKNGVGTGFTYVDKPSKSPGYIPSNLEMKTGNGVLAITTTAGQMSKNNNNQDNALGVGIDAPSQLSILSTTIKNVFPGTGNSEQAGLWFGNNEDNFVKLDVQSGGTGLFIEMNMEVGGSRAARRTSIVLPLAGQNLTLILSCDPATKKITGTYRINGGAQTSFTPVDAPPEFFSFDAAGIDPEVGTRSFGGIYASHSGAAAPIVVTFDEFTVHGVTGPPASGFPFTRSSHTVNKPTAMAWGPDQRLYVLEYLGKIHALTFNAQMAVTQDQVINALVDSMGQRLSLGLTIDPNSTPSNVILWVSSSSPSLTVGVANSGNITKLSGPNFSTVQQVITGLPRAIANHATNSIHFGPDGKLYIAQGGNTGAGAPNTANTEFGTMAEQPLSAAILVADVFAPGFEGDCNNPTDIFGPPPCDVITYCTGLRNTYDIVFHSNGFMYGPENGLGVQGTYPPKPTPPCPGFGNLADDPGEQNDPLNRLIQGKYYGHPNASRNECVFNDGSKQGVSPLPNYQPPMYDLGRNKSADGIIEYTGDAFCGQLHGNLIISNYSAGDDLTRIVLSPDGTNVLSATSLVGNFNDPLPLVMGPNGVIFVGEFGGNKVTTLVPSGDTGCWATVAPMPAAVLDAGGTAVGGKLYLVGGEQQGAGHVSTLRIYDAAANSWSTGPNMPGPAVEDPAAVAHNNKLYIFGGGTASFSGAVNNAAVFDPQNPGWTPLANMTTARAGAAIGAINGVIYVAGGLGANGASLNVVEAYNVASNTWSTKTSMLDRRDRAGSAVLNGKLYVFGGRIRNADGSSPNQTLNTVEMYDPASNTWTTKALMPTGRRAVAVGLLNGRAQIMGGERTASGGTFSANEEYDPVADTWRVLTPMKTPRHGTVSGTINNVVYVAGGGPQAGTSYTNLVETFR